MCKDTVHHFDETCTMTDEGAADDPNYQNHEALKLGITAWWECRHCDSWVEMTGDDGPDVSCFAELPPPPPYKKKRPTLLGNARHAPSDICQCGHRADSHYAELPSPCQYGRTMPDVEIMERCFDPTLTQDPRYGCRCIGFSSGPPS